MRTSGSGSGINRAVQADQQAGGHDCYLLLNDDAVLPTHGAAELLRVMNSRDDIGLVSGLVVTSTRETRYVWYQRWLGHLSSTPIKGGFPYLPATCLLVCRELARNGEIFDKAFFMYGEDVALTWKAKRLGLGVECADAVEINHVGSASSKHGEYFYEYHVARGHVLLARRLARHNWEIPLMYLGRFFYLSARAIVRAARFGSIAPLCALLTAWFAIDVRPPKKGPMN